MTETDTNRSTSWGFPSFAKDFPRHPELDTLVDAFARGDYATVRRDAPKLAASTSDPAIRDAATLLRTRLEPDPTSKILFALAAGLLVFLTIWWVMHDGPEGGQPAQKSTPQKIQ